MIALPVYHVLLAETVCGEILIKTMKIFICLILVGENFIDFLCTSLLLNFSARYYDDPLCSFRNIYQFIKLNCTY